MIEFLGHIKSDDIIITKKDVELGGKLVRILNK